MEKTYFDMHIRYGVTGVMITDKIDDIKIAALGFAYCSPKEVTFDTATGKVLASQRAMAAYDQYFPYVTRNCLLTFTGDNYLGNQFPYYVLSSHKFNPWVDGVLQILDLQKLRKYYSRFYGVVT